MIPFPVRLVIVLLPVFPAALLAWQAWQELRRSRQRRRWPQAEGRVMLSEVRASTVRVRRGSSAGSYRQAVRYQPRVVYEYQVGGRLYRGETLSTGTVMFHSEPAPAEREAQRYAPGQAVTVFYNPTDPMESNLDPRAGWAVWLKGLLALALIGMAVMFWRFL